MQALISRWGNSLGVRIPKPIADRLGLADGASVEIEARRGQIVISTARPHYVLKDLLKGVTPRAMRDVFDWGDDRGRESVEE